MSLHANKQAKLIDDRLIHAVRPATMSDHHIMCGEAEFLAATASPDKNPS